MIHKVVKVYNMLFRSCDGAEERDLQGVDDPLYVDIDVDEYDCDDNEIRHSIELEVNDYIATMYGEDNFLLEDYDYEEVSSD